MLGTVAFQKQLYTFIRQILLDLRSHSFFFFFNKITSKYNIRNKYKILEIWKKIAQKKCRILDESSSKMNLGNSLTAIEENLWCIKKEIVLKRKRERWRMRERRRESERLRGAKQNKGEEQRQFDELN